ncbi:hypothetical protein KEM48_002169 [Puccinia striiformis f. sp. tritici PST-130]|uniref:Uncharacterized protein n=1 Tax=Puccinia striiformis f. sp. tritici PST-78 TaxID=1165861 RepID=A0A0L0UWQ0_9BASI|nr:hypothetical protein KEM48_002169 [Puccinia striiformis f. sp. tritici PST-130]KNE91179.1 hypothetical protein PSTG_15384 [Puccinia striiformis f. sp. tritici PST-78]
MANNIQPTLAVETTWRMALIATRTTFFTHEEALKVQRIAAEDALNVQQMTAKALERVVKKLAARADNLDGGPQA